MTLELAVVSSGSTMGVEISLKKIIKDLQIHTFKSTFKTIIVLFFKTRSTLA